MKMYGTIKPSLVTLALVFAFLAVSTPVKAQDDSKKSKIEISRDGESVTIEVEDGEIRVNGEVIPDGADISDYLPEGFDSDVFVSDDGKIQMFGSGDGVFSLNRFGPRGNVWFYNDDENAPSRFMMEEAENLADKFREFQANSFELAQVPEFEVARDLVQNAYFFSNSPEVSKLERESREIATKLRRAEGSERAELENRLDELLEEIFEAKMEIREERIEKQRERLAKDEEALQERRARKSEIIERRKADLTGGDDRYRW